MSEASSIRNGSPRLGVAGHRYIRDSAPGDYGAREPRLASAVRRDGGSAGSGGPGAGGTWQRNAHGYNKAILGVSGTLVLSVCILILLTAYGII